MKKFFIMIFMIIFIFQCSNNKNPYSPANREGFFYAQLLPYLGKKDCSVVFMIFLNAANNLEPDGVNDLYEEIMRANILSYNKDITIIVLMDRIDGYSTSYEDWRGTRIYKITKEGTERLGGITINNVTLTSSGDNEELNMGAPQTLEDFVKYCMQNYRADYYILDIWNHGDGWRVGETITTPSITKGISQDEESGNDYLSIDEVRQVLENVVATIGRKIDIIYFDACLMQMVEVAYELRYVVNYIVASEDLVPGGGANYIAALEKIKDLDNTSALNLALELYNAYKEEYFYIFETTFSVIDNSGIDSLVQALNTFAVNLTNQSITAISNARYNTRSLAYTNNGIYYYADLYSFAQNMQTVPGAIDVMNSIEQIVKANYYNTLPATYGISIYFPEDRTVVETSYINNLPGLDFLNNCKWRDFIEWYKNQ